MDTRWVPADGPPPVWVDFNRGGGDLVYLDLPKTLGQLNRLGIDLREGVLLNVWDQDATEGFERDDLLATGVVERDPGRQKWVLRITWSAHESDLGR